MQEASYTTHLASSHVYAGGLRRSLGFYFSPPPPPSWSVTRNKVESSGAAAELLQWLEATTLLKQEAFLLALVGNVESGEEMRREKKERASFAFLSFLFLLDIFSLLLAHFIFFPILFSAQLSALPNSLRKGACVTSDYYRFILQNQFSWHTNLPLRKILLLRTSASPYPGSCGGLRFLAAAVDVPVRSEKIFFAKRTLYQGSCLLRRKPELPFGCPGRRRRRPRPWWQSPEAPRGSWRWRRRSRRSWRRRRKGWKTRRWRRTRRAGSRSQIRSCES